MKYDIKEVYDWPLIPKAILIVLMCVLLLFLAYFFDFSGSLRRLGLAKQQEIDLKTQFVSLSNSEADIKQELKKYPMLEEVLVAFQKKLIAPDDLPEVMNDILKMGEQNGLKFINFTPGKEEKLDKYIKITVKAVVTGTYDQIANFMSQVANIDRFVAIGNFTIVKAAQAQANAATAESGHLTADLTLEIYEAKAI